MDGLNQGGLVQGVLGSPLTTNNFKVEAQLS